MAQQTAVEKFTEMITHMIHSYDEPVLMEETKMKYY